VTHSVDIWRFFIGVLTGAALCTWLFSKLLVYGLKHSSSYRDRLREWLNHYDGWPLVFCRTCGTFISTAPDDEDRDDHCLGQRPCFVRHLNFLDEPAGCFEVQGPLCPVCDELLRVGPQLPSD
jgi:hypothetical protein